ncbi:MAG: DUF3500 domain-containing protein [Phototrophicaceae bacterium]
MSVISQSATYRATLLRVSMVLVFILSALGTSVVSAHEEAGMVADAIVQNAQQYLNTLDESQTANSVFEFDSDQKYTWSNLPTNMVQRAGITVGEMSDEQYSALEALLGSLLSDEGLARVQGIFVADDYLNEFAHNDRFAWSSANYYVSFYGQPTLEGAWGFQVTGHHLGLNMTMVNAEISITPTLTGVEPVEFTYDGVDYNPLGVLRETGFALMNALDADQIASSSISVGGGRGGNIVLGAGEDGTAAPAQQGLLIGSMTAEQQALAEAVIASYFNLVDEAIASELIAEYVAEFDETTFAWSGDTNIETATGSYYRLQGPTLWIEFSMEQSIAEGVGAFHYHTMMRDFANDFGASDLAQ